MKNYFLIIASLFCLGAYAQDPNFSQFQNSPLTLNPAMAGLGEGNSRLTANFRHTWIGNSTPFSTGLISYDAAILTKKISENDKFGVGVLALYDQSNGGALKASTVSLTAAYNKGLNASGTSSIGFGFQGMYVNRRLDYSRLSFEDQFGSGGFNLSVPSYDMGSGEGSTSYFDFNVGAIYRMQTNKLNSYIGGTITHLAKPTENFQDVSVRHGAGYSVNGGGTF